MPMRAPACLVAVALMLTACSRCTEPAKPAPTPPPPAPSAPHGASELRSPGGTRTASVFSLANAIGGNTQVVVDFGEGGGGVFAVDEANVALDLRWIDDDHLIIGYPERLRPSKQEHSIQNYDQRVAVSYETFRDGGAFFPEPPPPPPKPAESITVKGRRLRGQLVQLAESRYRYDYYDVDEPDSSAPQLMAKGFQGGGPSWRGIVFGVVALKEPALLDELELDEEGDGLSIFCARRETLVRVAELVTDVKADPELMKKAIAKATAAGEME
jgi:hypothetical protein